MCQSNASPHFFSNHLNCPANLLLDAAVVAVGEGVPASVLPDHVGRADYHGPSVNSAARFADIGAKGGQIACTLELAQHALDAWAAAAAGERRPDSSGNGKMDSDVQQPQQQQQQQHSRLPCLAEDAKASAAGAAPPRRQRRPLSFLLPPPTGRSSSASGGALAELRRGGSETARALRLAERSGSGTLDMLYSNVPGESVATKQQQDVQQQQQQHSQAPILTQGGAFQSQAASPLPAAAPPLQAPPPSVAFACPTSWPRTETAVEVHRLGTYNLKGGPPQQQLAQVVLSRLSGRLDDAHMNQPHADVSIRAGTQSIRKGYLVAAAAGRVGEPVTVMLPTLAAEMAAKLPERMLVNPVGMRRSSWTRARSGSAGSGSARGHQPQELRMHSDPMVGLAPPTAATPDVPPPGDEQQQQQLLLLQQQHDGGERSCAATDSSPSAAAAPAAAGGCDRSSMRQLGDHQQQHDSCDSVSSGEVKK